MDDSIETSSEKDSESPKISRDCWPLQYSVPIEPRSERTLIEIRKDAGAFGSDLDIFFENYDNPTTLSEEVLKKYCRPENDSERTSWKYAADNDRIAWIDDRHIVDEDSDGSSDLRRYQNPLCATDLHQALSLLRLERSGSPDAGRRLIYILDLHPAATHALAMTASFNYSPVLRDTMFKYLNGQAAMGVKVSRAHIPIFELCLHLPLLLFRWEHSSQLVHNGVKRPARRWIDLSFLGLENIQDKDSDKVCGIHEAQISWVVCGRDNYNWTGYCFVDSEIDGYLVDDTGDTLLFDPLSCRRIETKLSPSVPREYWIKVIQIRLEQGRLEWEYLVSVLETNIEKRKLERQSELSCKLEYTDLRSRTLAEAGEWCLNMLELLSLAENKLSDLISAWEFFKGQTHYFEEIYVRDIRDAFRQLQGHLNKIKLYQDWLIGYNSLLLHLQILHNGSSSNLKPRLLRRQNGPADQTCRITGPQNAPSLYNKIVSDQPDAIPIRSRFQSYSIKMP